MAFENAHESSIIFQPLLYANVPAESPSYAPTFFSHFTIVKLTLMAKFTPIFNLKSIFDLIGFIYTLLIFLDFIVLFFFIFRGGFDSMERWKPAGTQIPG